MRLTTKCIIAEVAALFVGVWLLAFITRTHAPRLADSAAESASGTIAASSCNIPHIASAAEPLEAQSGCTIKLYVTKNENDHRQVDFYLVVDSACISPTIAADVEKLTSHFDRENNTLEINVDILKKEKTDDDGDYSDYSAPQKAVIITLPAGFDLPYLSVACEETMNRYRSDLHIIGLKQTAMTLATVLEAEMTDCEIDDLFLTCPIDGATNIITLNLNLPGSTIGTLVADRTCTLHEGSIGDLVMLGDGNGSDNAFIHSSVEEVVQFAPATSIIPNVDSIILFDPTPKAQTK